VCLNFGSSAAAEKSLELEIQHSMCIEWILRPPKYNSVKLLYLEVLCQIASFIIHPGCKPSELFSLLDSTGTMVCFIKEIELSIYFA
jgi:hypothetical protein